METSDLKAALERLIDNTATTEDGLLIRNSLIEGKIHFETAVPHLIGEENVDNSITIAEKDNQVQVELGEVAYELVKESIFPSPPGIAPPFPALVFIGRENDVHAVKTLLGLTADTLDKPEVTVVRGWPGVGKTSLVGVIGRDPDVIKHFPDGVLWTSLNQEPDLISLMAAWGRALGSGDILSAPTVREATQRLALLLKDKRMLLIVDDVWNEAHAAPFFEARGSRCTLLITTRLNSVANAVAPKRETIFNLPVLSEESSLSLLKILAPSVVAKHPDECRNLVQSLEYLPLALHIAGRLLNSEERLGLGVKELLEEIQLGARKIVEEAAPIDRAEGGTIPTVSALLRKSTDMLDEKTRDCFAYLGPFVPKPATFDLAAMSVAWQMNDPRPIARRLVNHGLIEPVGAGRFQMHALLVQHAQSLLE